MGLSLRSKHILELGKKLVDELDLTKSVDTLGRWMAHYVAELIEGAESAAGEEKAKKQRECCEVVLELWRHRHELPDGSRPFEDFEPVFRALKNLDPADTTPRYFRTPQPSGAENSETEAKKWLDAASGIEHTARILIRYCLVLAADQALDKSQEWVALAEAAGLADVTDIPVIRVIIGERDLLTRADPDEETRKIIEDRLKRLEGFKVMSEFLAAHFRQELRELSLPKETP